MQREEGGTDAGILEAALRAQGSSLAAELARVQGVSRICALRGFTSVLPRGVLCAPLPVLAPAPAGAVSGAEAAHGGDKQHAAWSMLMNGALPDACAGVACAPDGHFKLHAVSLMTQCLQRSRDCLEVRACMHHTQLAVLPDTSHVPTIGPLSDDWLSLWKVPAPAMRSF
jgi:hypothetical protein